MPPKLPPKLPKFDDAVEAYMNDLSKNNRVLFNDLNGLISHVQSEFRSRGYSLVDVDERLPYIVKFWSDMLTGNIPLLDGKPWLVPKAPPATIFNFKNWDPVGAQAFLREHGYLAVEHAWTDEEMIKNIMIIIKNVHENKQYEKFYNAHWHFDKDLNNEKELRELAEIFLKEQKNPFEKEVLNLCKPMNSHPGALGPKCGNSHWGSTFQIGQRFDVGFLDKMRGVMGLEDLPVSHLNRTICLNGDLVPQANRPSGVDPDNVACSFLHIDAGPDKVGKKPKFPMPELNSKTRIDGGDMSIVIGPLFEHDGDMTLFRLLYMNEKNGKMDETNKYPGLRVSNEKTEIRSNRDYLGFLRGSAKYGGSSRFGSVCIQIPKRTTVFWPETVLHGKVNDASVGGKKYKPFAFGFYGGFVDINDPLVKYITDKQGYDFWGWRQKALEKGLAPLVYPCGGVIGAAPQIVPGEPGPFDHLPKCYLNYTKLLERHSDKLDRDKVGEGFEWKPKKEDAEWNKKNPGQTLFLQAGPNWPPLENVLEPYRKLPYETLLLTGWAGKKPPTGDGNKKLLAQVLTDQAAAAGCASKKKVVEGAAAGGAAKKKAVEGAAAGGPAKRKAENDAGGAAKKQAVEVVDLTND